LLLVAFVACLGLAVLIFGAAVSGTRALWLARPVVAPCYGLLGAGLAAHLVWVAYWIGRPVGLGASAALVIAALAVLGRTRPWHSWRSWSPLLTLSTGIAAATVGLGFLYGGQRDPFVTIASRFRVEPPDNVLPHLFADRIWKGESTTTLFGDWHGSDRPPLQSGLLLLVRPHELLTGSSAGTGGVFDPDVLTFALAASLVAQLAWIPAVYSLLRVLDFSERATMLAIVFCGATPAVFHSTLYTWPKLLSAALAIAAVALLVDLARHPGPPTVPVAAATVLGTLSFLAHGGAAFTAPLLVGTCLVALRTTVRRFRFRAVGVAAVAALATYLPWQLYCRIADPSTGRLLKWHLAGVTEPDDRGFFEALLTSYRSQSFGELIHSRLSNFAVIFDVDLSPRLDPARGWLLRVRDQDFFNTTFALGTGSVLLAVMLLTTTWEWFGRRRSTARHAAAPNQGTWGRGLVVWLSLASVVLWGLLMFIPGSAVVHHGSFAWIVILLAVPFAWVTDSWPRASWVALAITVGYSAVVYGPPGPDGADEVSTAAVAWLVAGVSLAVGAACWQLRSQPARARVLATGTDASHTGSSPA
jgi:hypothetical protein